MTILITTRNPYIINSLLIFQSLNKFYIAKIKYGPELYITLNKKLFNYTYLSNNSLKKCIFPIKTLT